MGPVAGGAFRFSCFVALIAFLSCNGLSAAARKWEGTIPPVAAKPEAWLKLSERLIENSMPYGAMAAARRMILLFPDLEVKERAYRILVQLVDAGYPYRLHADFANADIEPTEGIDFVQSYYLYKGIANEQAGTPRWAKFYLEKVDREGFSKALFYDALQKYERKDLGEAEVVLKKILRRPYTEESLSFASKVARTLARLYFERGQHEASLDVYQNFLLRLDQVSSSDWLEAAWNLYHLKRYPEALGYLFNLEASSSKAGAAPERFVLRALIYRELCSSPQIRALAQSYEATYGSTLSLVRTGGDLRQIPALRAVAIAFGGPYAEFIATKTKLVQESSKIRKLGNSRNLARYLYKSELADLIWESVLFEEEALKATASYLVNLGESLTFLDFDVLRRFADPDAVFAAKPQSKNEAVQERGNRFELRWEQNGTYWKDERLGYQADIQSACGTAGASR